MTSSALIDDFPVIAGLSACQIDTSSSVSNVRLFVRNTTNSITTISSITVEADQGDWIVQNNFSLIVESNLETQINLISTPLFVCSNFNNPLFTATYNTNLGTFIITAHLDGNISIPT